MSERYMICISVNHKIADYGYYRNWDPKMFLIEDSTMAALFQDCTSVEEYRKKPMEHKSCFIKRGTR